MARKSPAARTSGVRSKQSTKRTTVKPKVRRATSTRARTQAKRTATGGRKLLKRVTGVAAARKAMARRATALRRATKTGTSRSRIKSRRT
ncbi:hypothetical protein JY651_42195 [Pyxidicoccus parkwayensis]|uniref:Uncharacterized protein n=1 Tax=Pyxidicoccus parkwayensis TaxID=2813578 RepID=A0ABX7NS44_9BACT|nr:hypothetical protein [Pyxidicoccus parkwaysis]QSQ21704.1 hypothetical protein JY651_42195 [Pyxidicoccus parkwaysis]